MAQINVEDEFLNFKMYTHTYTHTRTRALTLVPASRLHGLSRPLVSCAR